MRNEYLPAWGGEAGCGMEPGAKRVVQCSNLPQPHGIYLISSHRISLALVVIMTIAPTPLSSSTLAVVLRRRPAYILTAF